MTVWVAHPLKLFVGELVRLEQDRVADADFADVVEPRGGVEELHLVLGPAQGVGDGGSVPADAPRVLARDVVAVFSGDG